jgi:hypothetical protein
MGERTGIGLAARTRLAFGLNALRQIGSDLPKYEAGEAQRPGIGHNGGPPLQEDPPARDWHHYCWKKAHKKAWKTPPREIALRRLRRAEELGMTYEEYTSIILDRGVFL